MPEREEVEREGGGGAFTCQLAWGKSKDERMFEFLVDRGKLWQGLAPTSVLQLARGGVRPGSGAPSSPGSGTASLLAVPNFLEV